MESTILNGCRDANGTIASPYELEHEGDADSSNTPGNNGDHQHDRK